MTASVSSHPSPISLQPTTRTLRSRSYWGMAWAHLRHDRLTLFAVVLLCLVIVLSLAAPWIGNNILGYSPTKTNLRERLKPPTWGTEAWSFFAEFTNSCDSETGCDWSTWRAITDSAISGIGACLQMEKGQCHWMGTDDAGRDVLTRALYGGRISLRIGLFVSLVSLTLGVLVGLVSGYYATTQIDDAINAIVMLIESVPVLFTLIILSRIFQPGPIGLAVLLGLFSWTGVARVVRGQIFSIRERDYVLSSRAIGSTPWRIMLRHILPNVASIVIVLAGFATASAILAEAGLSFLGVGIGPPLASWGNMMQGSLGNFTLAPWLVITPGFFIFLATLSIFLIGDGLRDALDPTLKNKK